MQALISTFLERQADWLAALFTHLQLSLTALLIACAIAVPCAIVLSGKPKSAGIATQITSIFQTIPSLALLGILIPLVGIGRIPAIIALVMYGILPIFQNTLIALKEIDPNLQEAGTAFGLNKWERLKKYEIPVSLPVIMSGVRTSAVMIVGTATLATLIGAGGLGAFIMLGIDRNNMPLILIGAISSALLAILFNIVIAFVARWRAKYIGILLLGVILSLFIPLIPAGSNSNKITIAGKLGPEPEILIHMYKALIEDKTDISVELKPSFGTTSFLYESLKSGKIDLYPEFTGTVVYSLLQTPPQISNDSREVYEAAKKEIYAQDRLVYLEPMGYFNNYGLGVKRQFAEQHQLTNISDLAKSGGKIKTGFTLEFHDRPDGTKGLEAAYGLKFDVVNMNYSLLYPAVESKEVDLIEIYTTDSNIIKYDMVELTDDKQFFPPYQGAPLLRQAVLDKHPELFLILNQLAGKISTEEMTAMNYEVSENGRSAEEVAKKYLHRQGLLSR